MIDVARDGRKAVVKPEGDVVASMASEFREILKGIVLGGVDELEVDLTGVGMIDSVGLGLFISAHNSLTRQGGKLKVVNASKDLYDLFRNMRLDQHFTVLAAA